jgi:outer membrane lipoprotein-sorting protein
MTKGEENVMTRIKAIWPVMLVAVLMLASCEKKAEESAWQQKLRQVAELGTVQYTVQKVVSNSDETWQIFGDRKILFSFKAVIKAGIDMDKFDAESVRISEDKKEKTKSISLVLPQPEILSYNIQPDDVKMIYNQVSFLRTEYTNEERDAIVSKGEMELKVDRELTDMILKDARQNAAMFMEMLLRENGFSDVTITFKKEEKHGKRG